MLTAWPEKKGEITRRKTAMKSKKKGKSYVSGTD